MDDSGAGNPKDADPQRRIEAKTGYAVGGLMVWSNQAGLDLVRGIRLQFMRKKGQALNPQDFFWSDWIGQNGEDIGVMLSGAGQPVIGIHGRAGGAIDALGIIYLGDAKSPRPGE
jgi:hypothetical protein